MPRAVAACADRFGRLDVLVNCAGIGLVGNVQETQRADWDRLLAVNVTGVFLCSQAGVDAMLAQDPPGGIIINIASVAAMVGIERRFAYSATKGAVLAMTRQLAIDYVAPASAATRSAPARSTRRSSRPTSSGSTKTTKKKWSSSSTPASPSAAWDARTK